MIIAYSTATAAGRPLREAFEAARDAGIAQLALRFSADADVSTATWSDTAEALLLLTDEFDIRLVALGGALGGPIHAAGRSRRAEIWQRFLSLLEIASACAVPVLTLKSGPAPAHLGLMEACFRTRRLLRPMVAAARQRGIEVCIEPVPRSPFALPADALLLLETCPELRFTYNPAHFVNLNVPLMVTEMLLGRAGHVRLCDAAPGRGNTPWGRGAVDPAWLLERLACRSYEGALAVGPGAGTESMGFLCEAVHIIEEVNWLFRRLPPL